MTQVIGDLSLFFRHVKYIFDVLAGVYVDDIILASRPGFYATYQRDFKNF